MDKEKYYYKVIDLIPEGKENAIHQKTLAILLNVPQRLIRHAVSEARGDGIPIVSSNSGYFFTEDTKEIAKCIRRLRSQADSINKASRALTKEFFRQKDKRGRSSNV